MIAKRIIIIMAMISFAEGWLGGGDISAYQSLSDPVAITGQATIPFTPGAVLDNFNADSPLNAWNCSTGTFGSILTTKTNPGYCTKSWDAAGQALKLTYDITQTNSYSGYFTQLGGGSLAGYTAVSFYVKGSAGREFFKVELKNTGTTKYWDANDATHYYRNAASVYINDFLVGGVTTTWQKVTIPLNNFANLDGLTSMKELVFTFENTQSTLNDHSPAKSAIYIDSIVFETAATFPVSIVKADAFGDKLFSNSLGGNIGVSGSDSTATLSFAALSDANHTSLNALKYDYDVHLPGSYIAAFFIFGGGYTDDTVEKPDKGGWLKVSQNLSAFNYITFWARAGNDATNPTGFKVELHDFSGVGTGEPFYTISWSGDSQHLTTNWQKYKIPLSYFADFDSIILDKTRVSEMVFTIEYYNTPTGKEIGTMYIDDVQFEK